MKSIFNEEKKLKRYLKNHISLNMETMVKFLITGTVAFSLTACGGGGSSNDSTVPPVKPPVVEETEVNKNNETHEISNSNVVITGKISGDQDNFIGLRAINSTVENKATITAVGNGVIGIHGTTDTTLFSIRANHVVTNSGNISIIGHEAVGMFLENGVVGKNNGTINMTSSIEDKNKVVIRPDDECEECLNKITYDKTHGIVVGMYAKNGSIIENNGEINIDGFGNGMVTFINSKGINNGEITLISGENTGTVKYYEEEEKESTDYYSGKLYEQVTGMIADRESTIENGLQGKINLKGEGNAMVAVEKSKAINNGDISLESIEYEGTFVWKDSEGEKSEVETLHTRVQGMYAENESEAVNNKNIYLKGHGNGINVFHNSIGINNGNILGETIAYTYKDTTTDSNGNIVEIEREDETDLRGMAAFNNSKIENNGKIDLRGSSTGMFIASNSTGINNGLINIEGKNAIGAELLDGGLFVNEENGDRKSVV